MKSDQVLSNHTAKTYKYFSLMASCYVTILILTMFLENRIISIGSIRILSGTLIIPLSYAISDVITEIYGYVEMRRLIWTSMICLYISAFIVWVIMTLPSDHSISSNNAYDVICNPFLQDIITYSIAAVISIFLNAFLISKWKILVLGRYFWLRSLGASMIGEFFFITIWGILGFWNKFPFHALLELMLVSYLYKVIYNIFMIIPSSILMTFLKKTENINNYDHWISFNPFIWET